MIDLTHFQEILKEYPNAPSYPVGENQVKVPAGWLIETAGWKGRVVGETGVHKNQALVLVNYGSATGEEIYQLSTDIIADINQRFKILLTREVNIL